MIPNFGIDPSDGWSIWEILRALALVGGAGGAIVMIVKLVSAILEFRALRAAEQVRSRLITSASTASFSTDEVKDALRNYVVPECAQTDPSNHNDLRYVADVREDVMTAVDRFIEHGKQYRHLLMLADSGMGKTTFCLNYYNRLVKKKRHAAVVPLGRPDAISYIRRIDVKSDCILLLDALDEDPEALIDAEARIKALMDASADFRSVIITCRSQFFANDASIPTRTGVAVIRPRKGNEEGEYQFSKLYLLPFSTAQVAKYISYSFPVLTLSGHSNRRSAWRLVNNIPELSVRPMLLALIPELIKRKQKVDGLFDLYGFMVDSWLEREKKWIEPSSLLAVSKILAIRMYNAKFKRQPDRISVTALNEIAKSVGIDESDWKHLTGRSLLNRDSEGNFKFSHRSVLEYLYVQAALDGEEACFEYSWTDMMRDLFVSWGHTADARTRHDRAETILSLDLTKLGMAPLASPLPRATSIRLADLRAVLDGGRRYSRRIPPEWRAQSIRVSKDGHAFIVRDLQFDLEWTVPDSSALDETILLNVFRSQAETSLGVMRLPSTEEFISLVDVDSRVDDRILDTDVFYWLGDRLGRSKYLVSSVGQTAISHSAVRLVGKSDVRGAERTAWVYELASVPKSFGDKVPEFAARVVGVQAGDSSLYRKIAMMSPEEYQRHSENIEGQLELILAGNTRLSKQLRDKNRRKSPKP